MSKKRAYIPKRGACHRRCGDVAGGGRPAASAAVEQLRREPQTVKQLAAALDVAQTKLYYHIKLLEERELDPRGRIAGRAGDYREAVWRHRLPPLGRAHAAFAERASAGRLTWRRSFRWCWTTPRVRFQRSVRAGLIDLSGQAPLDG